MTTRELHEQLITKHKYDTIAKEIAELAQAKVIAKQPFEGYPKYERVTETTVSYQDMYQLYKHVDRESYALLHQSTNASGITKGYKYELDYSDPAIVQEMLGIVRETHSNVIVGLLRAAAVVILILGVILSILMGQNGGEFTIFGLFGTFTSALVFFALAQIVAHLENIDNQTKNG